MKGQAILSTVIVALIVPLIITMLYVVQVNMDVATEGALTESVTDETLSAGANNTAISLGNNYVYDTNGITFNATGLTEDVNYTVDYDAGELTWYAYGTENDSAYLVDYEYFEDADKTTKDSLSDNANDSYDMAGILPIALIGIAILVAIIAAIGGLVMVRT